jgi:hypothetical protein
VIDELTTPSRSGSGTEPERFEVAVAQEEIDDLRRRLHASWLGEDFFNENWSYGTRGSFLKRLLACWADEYDWPAQQAEMNRALITSHIVVHVSDPSSLAFGLNDSPAGLAASLVERRYWLADNGGDIDNVYTLNELCTMLSLYWYTESIASSLRLYTANLRNSDAQYRLPLVTEGRPILRAPSAYAVFPHEVFRAPRSSVAEYVNLRRWTVMPRGGLRTVRRTRTVGRGRQRVLPPHARRAFVARRGHSWHCSKAR